jgi:hypothetical protein
MNNTEIKNRREEIYNLQIELKKELEHLTDLEWNNKDFKIGDRVKDVDGANAEFIISRFDDYFSYGNKIKKDGTPSLSEQWIRSPEKVEAAEVRKGGELNG